MIFTLFSFVLSLTGKRFFEHLFTIFETVWQLFPIFVL